MQQNWKWAYSSLGMSVTIHPLYRDRSVQFGHAVGLEHWVTIQLLYCDMVAGRVKCITIEELYCNLGGWMAGVCVTIHCGVL